MGDDGFLACITSEVGKEFEDLLPEYCFEGGSICRTQYELDCGMVVTEKSMEELRKLMLRRGYPESFCDQVTKNLNTDWTANDE